MASQQANKEHCFNVNKPHLMLKQCYINAICLLGWDTICDTFCAICAIPNPWQLHIYAGSESEISFRSVPQKRDSGGGILFFAERNGTRFEILARHTWEVVRGWGSMRVLPRPQRVVKHCHNITDDVTTIWQCCDNIAITLSLLYVMLSILK